MKQEKTAALIHSSLTSRLPAGLWDQSGQLYRMLICGIKDDADLLIEVWSRATTHTLSHTHTSYNTLSM